MNYEIERCKYAEKAREAAQSIARAIEVLHEDEKDSEKKELLFWMKINASLLIGYTEKT
ncbi:MAG: hypothetical protein HY306_02780 [Nitrosomonadales bacterium]|nr:hypothetical protein [Nitrosomonadales bacterium]